MLSAKTWNINYEDIEQEIGKGNFGKVFSGKYFDIDVAVRLLFNIQDKEMKKYFEHKGNSPQI